MGQRSREFGIRIAVGATRGNVMAVVFHQGLVLTLIVTSVGVGAALPAARVPTQLLFGISPLDATSFLLVCRFAGKWQPQLSFSTQPTLTPMPPLTLFVR